MEEYILIRRRNQKRIIMHFKDSGILSVSAPYRVPKAEIDAFVISKQDWIDKNKSRIPSHTYGNDDRIFFNGKDCRLLVIKGSPRCVNYMDNEILVTVPHPEKPQTVKKALYDFFSAELKHFILSQAPHWCHEIKKNIPDMEICNSKTRWGVCYPNKNLVRISAITACLPENLQEMILVHELCHLVYCNHGKDFHALLKTLMPEIENLEKKLKAIDKTNLHRNLF